MRKERLHFKTWTLTVGYNFISLSIASISIIDPRTPAYFPLRGNYSVVLQGADPHFGNFPVTISQTGVIPRGRRSLVVSMYWEVIAPIITVDGQAITMVPIQQFPNYSVYAGDITSFAGGIATLSFTAPGTTAGGQSFLELDNIILSTAAVPEPGSAALLTMAVLLLGLREKRM